MATAVKNPDDTYTVTLTAREQKTLNRSGASALPPRNKAAQLGWLLTALLADILNTYRATDAPVRGEKYATASDAVQEQVDALLGVG